MAQALIQPYTAGVQASAQAVLFDPRFQRSSRRRFHRHLIPQLQLANSLYVSSGIWPARGWILLRRGDYNNINPYATNLQLQIDDFQNGTLTFNNLSIVQARCVTRGIAADPDAIYLVELTDQRGLVYNQWFQAPINQFYNVRAPAYPGQYYTDSLISGTSTWTWSQMVGNIWAQMAGILPGYPGLPITPTSPVEGFSYVGVSAWEAVNQILDLLGCAVAVDLTQATAPYSIVDLSVNDTSFAALQSKYVGLLEDDLEYIDTGAGRVPREVIVYFQRRNEYYGTEETVRMDNLQWSSTPSYAVTVNGPFPNAIGIHYLWSDFTVRFDVDNNPLAADVTTANAVAAEQVQEYYNRLIGSTQGYMRQTYAGALPFTTGSSCDGVCWHMDFRAQDYSREDDPVLRMTDPKVRPETRQSGRLGWRTELIRGPRPAWPEVDIHAR